MRTQSVRLRWLRRRKAPARTIVAPELTPAERGPGPRKEVPARVREAVRLRATPDTRVRCDALSSWACPSSHALRSPRRAFARALDLGLRVGGGEGPAGGREGARPGGGEGEDGAAVRLAYVARITPAPIRVLGQIWGRETQPEATRGKLPSSPKPLRLEIRGLLAAEGLLASSGQNLFHRDRLARRGGTKEEGLSSVVIASSPRSRSASSAVTSAR